MPEKPDWWMQAMRWSEKHIRNCQCHGTRHVYWDFPFGHPLFARPIPCVCIRAELAQKHAERLRRLSGLSDIELDLFSFERFDPAACRPQSMRMTEAMASIKRQCEAYARDPQGWLVLIGGVGSGKTHLASAIARYRLDENLPAFMATMPRILNMLRAGYNDAVTFDQRSQMLEQTELLIIDDLGAEKATEWASEQLYSVVNARYLERRPMVITSNMDLEQADGKLDARILSRLREGTRVRGWSRILTLPCGDARPYIEPAEMMRTSVEG